MSHEVVCSVLGGVSFVSGLESVVVVHLSFYQKGFSRTLFLPIVFSLCLKPFGITKGISNQEMNVFFPSFSFGFWKANPSESMSPHPRTACLLVQKPTVS